jgi:hypothetical protein
MKGIGIPLGVVVILAAVFAAPAAVRADDAPPPRVAAHQHLISPQFAKVINQPVLDGAGLLKLMD